MNFDKVAPQLGEGWATKLKPFIESKEFDDIYAFLKQQSMDGRTICPHHSNVFRAFRETPYESLKCVFILQDPYPWVKGGKMIADGIAMSCSNTGICQPSLDLFYDGMADDLEISVPHHPDLTYLCHQGVLFLNTSLTVELNKPSSHKGLWDKFMMFLVEEVINYYNTGLIYVSFGKNARLLTKAMMPFLHWGFEVEHPAAAAHKERAWKHENIFSKINKILRDCNNEKINWAYGTQIQETKQSSGIRAGSKN
jgi:uracil-DNA glycosylase